MKDWLLKAKFNIVEVAGLVLIAVAVIAVIAWYSQVKCQQLLREAESRNIRLREATFRNPFPQVRIADELRIPDSNAYKRQYDFTENWFTWNIPVWESLLAPYKGKPGIQYLEIGVYEGRSAIWMLENILTHPEATLTGIDVFDGPFRERCFANLELSGVSEKATMITGYSQAVLRQFAPETFDIVYIDGSHAEADVLEDAVLCSRLLKQGGIMIFDDYRWAGCFVEGTSDSPTDFPKTAIDAFVECFWDRYEVIHNSYQLILRKRTAVP
jgi:predicted O-methyltransferase YrrM